MRSVARLLAGLVLLVSTTIGALALTAGPASACSCVEPTLEFFETHEVAFSGVVTDRRTPGDEVIVTVRTDRVFKGEVTKRVDVVGGQERDTCSVDAQDGDSLLVFGSRVDGEMTSGLCSTVADPAKERPQLLAGLGEGVAPSPGYSQVERRTLGLTHDQFVTGRAILGVVGLVALCWIAFAVWRARRHTS